MNLKPPNIIIEKRILTSLKDILDKEKYCEFKIFDTIKKSKTLLWKYKSFERNCKHPLLQLFFLNKGVQIKEIKSFIPNKTIEELKKINLLKAVNDKIFSYFTIFAYDNKYILSDNFWSEKKFNEYVFTGETSFLLLNKLEVFSFPHKIILDLGSGSGLILLALYEQYKIGIGVDINKRAIKLGYINILLNQLQPKKIRVITGNWVSCFRSNSFDLIVANFPFAPVPPSTIYPIYANGGETGFDPLKNEFESIYESLKVNGLFVFLTGSIGDEKGSLLIKLLKYIVKDKPMNFSLNEIIRVPLRKYVESDLILSKRPKRVLDFYQSKRYTHVYLYFCLLKKTKNELNLKIKKRKFSKILNLLDKF
jgi:tRNA1(Val) A37 N6-methylase TrmN6